MSGAPWWRSYFDDRYFQMHDPLFPEERSRREAAGMRELLALPFGARVLDAPCGWGRHATLLAEAGLDVIGADLSLDLLRRAPEAPTGHAEPSSGDDGDVVLPASPPRYVAADIRHLPFADASFDAVINVFTSLGLFLDDAEDIVALTEARRVLRPGGALLLESMHRDDVIRSYAERDRWTLPDGTEIRVQRHFDPVSGISYEKQRWRKGEEKGRKAHAMRLRTATEIAALLEAAGFGNVEWYGNWEGEELHFMDESVIAVARA